MTIQQLEYLIAVDKHRHFGQAAAACFVTQPTLSAQLSKLEKDLGVILFDRSKMPVIPKACVRVCPDKVMMIYALEQAATIRVQSEARYLRMIVRLSLSSCSYCWHCC